MRLIPDSLFGRSLAVLFVGLLATHFASSLIHYSDRDQALAIVGGGYVGERIATVVRLFEEAPATERLWLAHATKRPGFAVAWGDVPELPADGERRLRESIVAAMLSLSLDGIAGERLRVAIVDPAAAGPAAVDMPAPPAAGTPDAAPGMAPMMRYHMRMMGPTNDGMAQILRVSVGLADGTWLNLATLLPPAPPFWSERLVLSLSVTLLATILLAGWAVRRMTTPLEVIAGAADRLGRDMHAPPLPETGPGEVRRAAHAFNRMQARIRDLVDARTRMIAAISHDLRTPITRLRLRAEFIEDDTQRDKTLADLAEMEQMVASVLAFARQDAEDEPRETVDLAALVQGVCDDLADAGKNCVFAGAPHTPFSCAPLALRRAVANLAENAVRYGGVARVALRPEADQAIIRVDDDGPGIPEEMMARVFEPFFRLEASRSRETGGTGIGLCVVQSVARAHGGEVRLTNRPEGGLGAELVLPR